MFSIIRGVPFFFRLCFGVNEQIRHIRIRILVTLRSITTLTLILTILRYQRYKFKPIRIILMI